MKDRVKRKWWAGLRYFCCAAVEDHDADSMELSMSRCGGGTSRTGSVTLTEEKWSELQNKETMTMTKDEFSEVLNKISGWVEEAVKEVFAPALQWSMEQNLHPRRSSEEIPVSCSPHGAERGETPPSERLSISPGSVSEKSSSSSASFPGSSCSLLLMATSPFSVNSCLDGAIKPLVDLKRGLKCLSVADFSARSTTPPSEPLKDLFGITKDSIFKAVHSEVTSSLRDVVMKEPSGKMTLCFTQGILDYALMQTLCFTQGILDYALMQIHFTLSEMYHHAESGFSSSTSKELAEKLQSATLYKMQDVVQLSLVSDWLSASQGSPVDISDELEEMLPLVTAKIVATVFENLFNTSIEGTSEDLVSDTPLFNLVEAVHDKIRSDLFKAAINGSGSSSSDESSVGRCSLAAASDFVSAVTGQSEVTFEEEFKLADPSIDAMLYRDQIRMVSEKVLESTQTALKDVFIGNLLKRAQAALTAIDTMELKNSLLSGSQKVVKSIIENITARLPLFSVRDSVEAVTGQFLQTLEDDLELLFMWQLSESSIRCPEIFTDPTVDRLINNEVIEEKKASSTTSSCSSLDLGGTRSIPSVSGQAGLKSEDRETNPRTHKRPFRFPKMRIPKLRWKNPKIVPLSVVSQEGPVPTDGPSNSRTTSTSTSIPVAPEKTLFSRVATAFSKIFRK